MMHIYPEFTDSFGTLAAFNVVKPFSTFTQLEAWNKEDSTTEEKIKKLNSRLNKALSKNNGLHC